MGQVLRYISYVQDELAEIDQDLKGIVIALDDDERIRRVLPMVPSIEFDKYKVSFNLLKDWQSLRLFGRVTRYHA